jgi:ASC-1-like (ASCH) protein/ribosomal protein S18 acetylase RimI-like enzyme
MNSQITIREAVVTDFQFVVGLMNDALGPFYGGDHAAHAERIFNTHTSGGHDRLGFFSHEQKMFIAEKDGEPAGIVHVVGKRQGTYKISPLIVAQKFRSKSGIGSRLLNYAESYAKGKGARQIYCTVALQNTSAFQFFLRKGYTVAGRSDSHYKQGITESMLYKFFVSKDYEELFDRPHISVLPCSPQDEAQVRVLLLEVLPKHFDGIDDSWVTALFSGYRRSDLKNINDKYKLIYVATDRQNQVLGVAGATPKKGEPIKLMPFIAKSLPAFSAMLADLPFALKCFGHKLYLHTSPTAGETVALQQNGWRLDAALPEAYHPDVVTQQWSLDIMGDNVMRIMRLKQRFLDQVRKGEKTLEVRVGYPQIKSIRLGERIRLMSRTETQDVSVKGIRDYAGFQDMLAHEKGERVVPGLRHDELLRLLQEIYPPSKEHLGVIVLEIEPVQILHGSPVLSGQS